MSELKACPFCGNKLEIAPDGVFEETCRCRTKSMTVKEWNTRPIEDALRSENERLNNRLAVAVSLKADNKDEFDWNVLDRIRELETSLTVAQEENKRMRELTVELIRLCKDIKQEAISQEQFSEPVGENLMDEWDIAIENVESALNGGK